MNSDACKSEDQATVGECDACLVHCQFLLQRHSFSGAAPGTTPPRQSGQQKGPFRKQPLMQLFIPPALLDSKAQGCNPAPNRPCLTLLLQALSFNNPSLFLLLNFLIYKRLWEELVDTFKLHMGRSFRFNLCISGRINYQRTFFFS